MNVHVPIWQYFISLFFLNNKLKKNDNEPLSKGYETSFFSVLEDRYKNYIIL